MKAKMKTLKNPLTLTALALTSIVAAGCSHTQATTDSKTPNTAAGSTTELVLTPDIEWGPLNPARGDKGPKAGKLWGDRTGTGPSGFLVKFVDGFSSPPHIHNITYRGVVISGLVHNDDPEAADMWMPAGSFWTQPAGEIHITAAKGRNNVAYIEIDNGPYLVLPTEQAFEDEEKPINVDKSNIVWLDASNLTWITPPGSPGSPGRSGTHANAATADGPGIAFLWGEPQDDQLNGTLLKLPAGFHGTIQTHGPTFRAVVIQGRPKYREPGKAGGNVMEPGNYFGSQGPSTYQLSSDAGEAAILYIRTEGKYEVVTAKP